MLTNNPNMIRNTMNGASLSQLTRGRRQSPLSPVQPIFKSRNDIRQSSGIDIAIDKCQYYFQHEFTAAVGKLQIATIDKRQFGAGIISGFLLSNLVSTVEERLFSNHDSSEIQATLAKKLNNMNENSNIVKMLQEVQGTRVKELSHWVNHLSDTVHTPVEQEPELSVEMSYIISKIVQRAELINRLRISVEQNRPDLITLSEILYKSSFGKIHLLSTKLEQLYAVNPTQIRFSLPGHVKATNTDIFNIHNFTFASREGNMTSMSTPASNI